MYYVSEHIAIGSLDEVRTELDDTEWELINVSSTPAEVDSQHFPLNDGVYDGGNTQEEFNEAVAAIRDSIQNGKTCVYCQAGESRSVSTLATALAAENEQQLNTVIGELMAGLNTHNRPASSLLSKARTYLEQETESR